MIAIPYSILLGATPPPPVRTRPLHGNEGPNWKLTPARMAQRAAARAKAIGALRTKNAAHTAAVREAVIAALAAGPLTTPALAFRVGVSTKALRDGHLAPMRTGGQISSREVPSPHGGPPTLEWQLRSVASLGRARLESEAAQHKESKA